ncbi:hypothetical protein F5Y01DRAFT_268000 [Xylaria sp. FL0043]|nr:hypothetical protein F5Y01DRAFT_268000 [Xylaria sp. FL0043]
MANTIQRTQALRDLVREVASAIQDVDEQVLSSDYIRHSVIGLKKGTEPVGLRPLGFEAVGFDYEDPEAHFENFDSIRLWEKYFAFILREWNLDQHGERMSNSELNFIIERLTAPATRLDHYGPLLTTEYGNVPNGPAKRVQGIEKRRTLLNGFLNSAEVALEVYYKKRKVKPTLRQRRPVADTVTKDAVHQADEARASARADEAKELSPSRNVVQKLFRGFISNGTLISFTTLITLASAILSAYSYSVAISSSAPKAQSWNSPEFYNTLQSALMQLLSLYVTVLPALRHRRLQSSYHRWSWVLAGLGVVAPLFAIGYFSRGPDLVQLVLFVGSAVQSTIVLQLVWAVDEVERKQK